MVLAALFLAFLPASGFAADLPPIVHFHEVDPGAIYRGGRPGEEGLDFIADLGVKTVIDLQGGDLNSFFGPLIALTEAGETPQAIGFEEEETDALGMAFFSEPLDSFDPVDAVEAKRIERALQLMHNPANQPVYVHCKAGVDRTGLVVALYRVRYEGWSVEEAHQEMIDLGHGFLHQEINGNMDRYLFEAAYGAPFEL